MVINTNTSALSTASLLAKSSSALSASLSRLSSGSKITSPADDGAGLAVSMNLVAQEGENTAASSNVANAVSFNQTQDGYLQQVNTALDRMSELAVQAQDVTKSSSDLKLYNNEFSTLATYVNTVATQSFNGVSLFNGNTLSVTVNSDGSNSYSNKGVTLGKGTAYDQSGQSLTSSTGALAALGTVTKAISQLATDRAQIGANAFDVEQQSVGGQQPDHGCGRGPGEHQLRQGEHPRPDRHGDVGPGELRAADCAETLAIELSG